MKGFYDSFCLLHLLLFAFNKFNTCNRLINPFFSQKKTLSKLLPQYLEMHIIVEKALVSQTISSFPPSSLHPLSPSLSFALALAPTLPLSSFKLEALF